MPTPDVIAQQTDWPNPAGAANRLALVTPAQWAPRFLTSFGAPGQSITYDYPNPRGAPYPIALRTWLRPLNLSLRGADTFPSGRGVRWPVPRGRTSPPEPAPQMPTTLRLAGAPPVSQSGSRAFPEPRGPVWGRFLADPGYFPAVFVTPVIPPAPPPTPPAIVQTLYASVASYFQPAYGGQPDAYLPPSAQQMIVGDLPGRMTVARAVVGVRLIFNLSPPLGATRQINRASMTLRENTGIDIDPASRMFGAPTLAASNGRPAQAAVQILSNLVVSGVYVATLSVGLTDGSTQTFVAAFYAA